MPHDMNLDNEQAPKRRKLLAEGWRVFKIIAGRDQVSKAGNPMCVLTIEDEISEYQEDIYCVSTEGKRWALKTILTACGIEKNTDGNYSWDYPDIIGKRIMGLVEHEPNEYINRDGETVKTTQHRIVDFKVCNEPIYDPREVS